MQGGTNIPEDRFVNTLHFNLAGVGSTAAAAAALIDPISDFYLEPTSGDPIGKLISIFVKREVEVRFYDMAQVMPRVPVIETFTMPTSGGGVPPPEECAIVASFHGAPPVTPRRRGRIYIGPLGAGALSSVTATTPQQVIAAVRTQICSSMSALAAANVGWSVYSPTADDLIPVVGGWCDNAFDTQRRRGMKATTRTTWSSSI
jgi:hypothetical protein